MLLLPPFFDAARFDLRRSTLSAVDFLLPAAPLVGDASAAESFAGLRTSCARAAGKHGSLITVTVMSSRYSPPCRRGVKRVGEVGLMSAHWFEGSRTSLTHLVSLPLPCGGNEQLPGGSRRIKFLVRLTLLRFSHHIDRFLFVQVGCSTREY